MIKTFGNKLAKDLVEKKFSKEVRAFPAELIDRARRKLAMLHATKNLGDLKSLPGNKLETLRGDKKGSYSIRINEQWRVVFVYMDGDAYFVRVEDYHK